MKQGFTGISWININNIQGEMVMKIKDLKKVVKKEAQHLFNTQIIRKTTNEELFEGTFNNLPNNFDEDETVPVIRGYEILIRI